ncbi:MAG: serine/threonine-protein kinase [Myxococcota bacterium]
MPNSPPPNNTLPVEWQTVDAHGDPSATLQPPVERSSTSSAGPSPGGLDALGPLTDLLGRGGMAEVFRAQQRSVGRSVAVKVARASATHPVAVRRALQEAWITGMLEHSHIVPVYDIVQSEDGKPHILRRAIKGKPWRAVLPEGTRPLAWHIDVLIQVCHAVAFAHERGILHRDLKPDNVMIGEHGQVHVLDWGLAVSMDDRHPDWIPRAAAEDRLVGTPRFIAPEMVRAQGSLLGEHTDIYLLGGVLHLILTGQPPHSGHTDLHALLRAVPSFEPVLDATAASPLNDLCRACLRANPADRPRTASEVRERLTHWVRTRQAVALAQQGREQLSELTRLLEEPDGPKHEIYERFAAARFGLQQAIREWPEHPTAADDLRAAVTMMTRHHLDSGRPEAAEPLLAELAPPPQDLAADVRAAAQAAAAKQDRLATIAADQDVRVGVRTRVFVVLVTSAVWLSLPAYLVISGGSPSWFGLITATGVLLLAFVTLMIWARQSLTRTALNRATAWTLMAVPLAHSITDVLAWSQGLGPDGAYAYRLAAWAIVAIMFATTVTARTIPTAIAYCAAAVVAATWPSRAPLAALLANVVLLANFAAMWGPAWAQARGWQSERPDPSGSE